MEQNEAKIGQYRGRIGGKKREKKRSQEEGKIEGVLMVWSLSTVTLGSQRGTHRGLLLHSLQSKQRLSLAPKSRQGCIHTFCRCHAECLLLVIDMYSIKAYF